MNKLLAALVATTALAAPALAQDEITEFRLGVLGGENAQDRMATNQCFADKIADALGVRPLDLPVTPDRLLALMEKGIEPKKRPNRRSPGKNNET